MFDPFEFDVSVTVSSVLKELEQRNYNSALMLAIRLNEQQYLKQVVESIPPEQGIVYLHQHFFELQINIWGHLIFLDKEPFLAA